MTRTRTALIVGGGIAGPAAAMALQKAGIEPVIYEARPAGERATGVFLTLGSNGIDALRVLGADEAVARGFSTPTITLRGATGKHLGATRTGGSLPDGTSSQTLRRADLYEALHEQAESRGIRIERGRRLVNAEEIDGGVRAVFADGSEAVGDVLIGCDGVHSTVRRVIDATAPAPSYAGLLNSGGYARGVDVAADPGCYEMIFGKRAFFGYAVAPDGDVWWFANVPRRDQPAHGELEMVSGEDWRRRLLELYAEDAGPAAALVRATSELTAPSPVHTIPHLPTWHRERMIVIGDAAHAPSPSSGQGASLSIEDAVVLAQCLRDASHPQAAFAGFVAARRPRVERIIRWAARVNSSKAAGPVARTVRDVTLPGILKLTADSKALRQIYDFHIDWDTLMPLTANASPR